ncbi:MAG: winged helix-turn-helix transcriptional regulator [Anaerolineales bacterium]
MAENRETTREMILLEKIENDPNVTQASLATQLGVAVGTVNWHLKRMIAKGYVKVKRAERRKLRYIITPEGITFRAHLTIDYIEQSFLLYRNIRKRVRELLAEVKRDGYDHVHIDTETSLDDPNISSQTNDIADICRLTCLEQGIKISQDASDPTLMVHGVKVTLRMDSLQ